MPNPTNTQQAPKQQAVQQRACEPATLEKLMGTATMQKQLQAALPRHITPQQIVRQAMTLLRTTPQLCECSQFSVLSGIFKAAELGLALSGPLGQAYLVPRWNNKLKCKEATFQVGYKGIFQLAYRSSKVKKIEMRTRHLNDHFTLRLGTQSHIDHVPNLENPGEAVGYYTVATLTDGSQDFEYMSKKQVQEHRERFSPKRENQTFSPWDSDFDAMAQKTTARMLGKRLPAATELQEAIAEDERGEQGMVAMTNLLDPAEVSEPPMTPSKSDDLAEELAREDAKQEEREPGSEG